MAKFKTEDASHYDSFFEDVTGIYDAVITDGLEATPFLTWGSLLRFLPKALSLGGLRPVYSYSKKYFRDERNGFAFSFHPLFIGGSPFLT